MTTDTPEESLVVDSVENYYRWVKGLEGRSLLYRGLADSKWEVEASAVRRLKQRSSDHSADVPSKAFHDYIGDLLQRARGRGFGIQNGEAISDFELLAELQHYGAATCLIDFTISPIVALWFACGKAGRTEREKDVYGKVVAICTDDLDKYEEITYEKIQAEKSVLNFLREDKLYIWKPSDRITRSVVQQSIFVLGKMVVECDMHVMIGASVGDI